MWIAVGTDAVNFAEALVNDEYGMSGLYLVRAGFELGLAGALTRTFVVAIMSGAEVEALGPPAWIGTAIILVISVVIDLLKDPPTLTWTRNCLWGPSKSYLDAAKEQADFQKATAG
ncbi:hypothetical protein [Paraburkholderia bannensis]|uniref:hypothetical protein n=1 Tax=Paraburkholderia bannensis TaxID=765414 RepID=UPI002AB6A75E|nr:hypothetical protein [Paraburkholderia bannensis]